MIHSSAGAALCDNAASAMYQIQGPSGTRFLYTAGVELSKRQHLPALVVYRNQSPTEACLTRITAQKGTERQKVITKVILKICVLSGPEAGKQVKKGRHVPEECRQKPDKKGVAKL